METFQTSGDASALAESNEVGDGGWMGGKKRGRSTCAERALLGTRSERV